MRLPSADPFDLGSVAPGSAHGPARVRHDGERAGADRRTDGGEGEPVKSEEPENSPVTKPRGSDSF